MPMPHSSPLRVIRRMSPQPRRGGRQDWRTPEQLLRAVLWLLSVAAFTIDLAATPRNAVTRRFYTRATDALRRTWRVGQGWAWCNPPYANLAPWMAKAVREARRGA